MYSTPLAWNVQSNNLIFSTSKRFENHFKGLSFLHMVYIFHWQRSKSNRETKHTLAEFQSSLKFDVLSTHVDPFLEIVHSISDLFFLEASL